MGDVVTDPLAWMTRAVCAETWPDLFFPRDGDKGYEMRREALSVCAGCTVREECLTYALDNALDYGIFGGLTGEERRRIGRKRKPPNVIARSVCGTTAGYSRHKRRKERACEACKAAEALRSRERDQRRREGAA